jgi:protein TonB
MADSATKFSTSRRRPKPAMLVLIVLFHILAVYGLARAFAPGITQSVERNVVAAFTVTVTTPEEEVPPDNEQVPDEGAAGEQGKKAVARAETAPEIDKPLTKKPAPKASSTGNANSSGAKDDGPGPGASGEGDGPGSGRAGGGAGGAIANKPSVKSGNLNTASDFPVPDGGRKTRFGKSVTVHFTVTKDGQAMNCSVARTQVDAETTALVCGLVMRKIRFNPARTRDGAAVEARYGYRVDFSPR